MSSTVTKELSRREWISSTEEAIAEDVATRDSEQREIERLRIEYEVAMDNRYLVDPRAVGLPSPTTTVGKMKARIVSLEDRVASRTRDINQRASLLEKAKAEQLAEDQAEEAKAAYDELVSADARLRELILSDLAAAPAYWENVYLPAAERADRCETCHVQHSYKHFERLLFEYVPRTPEVYLSRIEGKSYEPRNRTRGGLENSFSRSSAGLPEGFDLANGFGG